MAHSFTINYNLIKPEYGSNYQNGRDWLTPLWASMETIDTELKKAEDLRNSLTSAEGFIYSNGDQTFSIKEPPAPLFESSPQSGMYYPLAGPLAVSLETVFYDANVISLFPVFWPFSLSGSPVSINLGFTVTSASSGVAKVVVYSNSSADTPEARLASSSDIQTTSTGLKSATNLSLTGTTELRHGQKIWVGIWFSAPTEILQVPKRNCYQFGGMTTSAYLGTMLAHPQSFGVPPSSWSYSSSEIVRDSTIGVPAIYYYA